MRRALSTFALIAVSAMSLASCQKAEIINTTVNNGRGTFRLTVEAAAQELGASSGTKTYIATDGQTPNTIFWGTDEQMTVAVTRGGVSKFAASTATSAFDGAKVASFDFEVEAPGQTGKFTFGGVYPTAAAVASTDAASFTVALPAEQAASASSYDPAAYIMVAKPESFDALQSSWTASFRRATALNKITLTNLAADIVSVEITATGKDLAGQRHINLNTGVSGDIFAQKSDKVTVSYATPLASASPKDIWFTSWGVSLAQGEALTVKACSATKSYTRTINANSNGISFKEGYLNTLSINMSAAAEESLGVKTASLTGDEIKAKFTPDGMAYGTLETYVDGDITWDAKAFANADMPYIQLNKDTGRYLKITAPSNILEVRVTLTSASFTGKENTMSSYTAYTGTVRLKSDDAAGNGTTNDICSASAVSNVAKLTIANPQHKVVYLKTSGGARIWGVEVDYGSGGGGGSTVTMTTGGASDVSSSGATLAASYSGAAGGTIFESGFQYRLSGATEWSTAYYDDALTSASGSYSVTLTGLTAGQTYEYRAWMQFDTKDCFGEVKTFVTEAATKPETPFGKTWLELPAWTDHGTAGYLETLYGTLSGQSESVRNYTYYYDYEHYASLWVAYPLSSEYMSGSASGSWAFNPNIAQEKQVDVRSSSYGSVYGESEYSRGHLVPNADRGSSSMKAQVYYLTNQVPQLQSKFNDGVWNSMEGAIRSQASGETVYVVTGVSFEKIGASTQYSIEAFYSATATPKTLVAPPYFWTVVLKVKTSGETVTSAQTIGFWFENKAYSDSYTDHAFSVDQIESWTGMDFFVNLPDTIESAAETNTSWSSFAGF